MKAHPTSAQIQNFNGAKIHNSRYRKGDQRSPIGYLPVGSALDATNLFRFGESRITGLSVGVPRHT